MFAVLSVLLQAISQILDKFILSIKKLGFKDFFSISYPLYALGILIIFLITKPPLSMEQFTPKSTALILFTVFSTLSIGYLFYRALEKDQLGEIHSLDLLSNFTVIIFSSFIFTDERNLFIIVPAIIATTATVWSHWEKHHLKLAKKTLPYLAFSLLLYPLEASSMKVLLETWNPASLQLVRFSIVAVLLMPFTIRSLKNIALKTLPFLILTNGLSAVAWILFYSAYKTSGITYTILIVSLAPLLVYISSVVILKEKLHFKKTVAFAIVLIAIISAQFYR